MKNQFSNVKKAWISSFGQYAQAGSMSAVNVLGATGVDKKFIIKENGISTEPWSVTLKPTSATLQAILVDFIQRELPHRRVAKLAGLLLLSGIKGTSVTWRESLLSYLVSKRHTDGAWVDCEDTAWCIFVLQYLGESSIEIELSIKWLAEERSGDGWGYCHRDTPSIPITSTVRILVPSLRDERSATWLNNQWLKDINRPQCLSYKAAWFLLAQDKQEENSALFERTLYHLLADQRDDGGWGPWRNHPAPTDCFSTGIAMWAIASTSNGKKSNEALKHAIHWCESHRIDNGLFATHFIEEGSAWLHLGWSAALHKLNR